MQAAVSGQPVSSPVKLASNVTGLNFTGDSRDQAIVYLSLSMSEPWDNSGDPTHVYNVLLPDQEVHLASTGP